MASEDEKNSKGLNPAIPPSPSAADYQTRLESVALTNDGAEADPDFFVAADPMDLFAQWLKAARERELNDPHAMALASVDAQGAPNLRIVLLKDYDARGFSFFTNELSAKGQELATKPVGALAFHWKSLRRQVRIRGSVERVDDAAADAYFATRARDSQIGAWASAQSQELASRAQLEAAHREYKARFGDAAIPRPPHWGGFRLVASRIEFWRSRDFRLHDRREFFRDGPGHPWSHRLLNP